MGPAHPLRIHVTGAAGAGSTTLGRALAARLGLTHHDTDDYHWLPTPVPFAAARPVPERVRLMEEAFLTQPGWVLSGSVAEWGEALSDRFDAIVFLRAPRDLRLERLRLRETQRHGVEALVDGGPHFLAMEAFLAAAARYDEAGGKGRNLWTHRAWLARQACPVIESDGARPVEAQLSAVLGALGIATAPLLDAARAPA
ncbi:hypothetical protein HMH01_12580 [Halovulum dunhuangense]|uniref:Adenylate kinase family enzyme n=1 Tax=Halovulum dunhuangense TaxID=1505036 RepID=A0A849L4U0_9RHOB|nr:hypothetical protein [Halovulum dunhuangense]NNU81273.1 hypothetical protein [Halovulum dunhuangense]